MKKLIDILALIFMPAPFIFGMFSIFIGFQWNFMGMPIFIFLMMVSLFPCVVSSIWCAFRVNSVDHCKVGSLYGKNTLKIALVIPAVIMCLLIIVMKMIGV